MQNNAWNNQKVTYLPKLTEVAIIANAFCSA